ncbi:MAG: DNA replication/repair protein RecF [Chloroflexi bacterium]|nr:DNA replication/repair protein RecF [Chloroflexota bacterium]
MRLLRLQLFDYRNFHRLDLELPAAPAVFVGDNAQGKTNLLEAVYLLATMRSLRAETDSQLIRRDSPVAEMPAARVLAHVETAGGPLKVEVALVARPGPYGPIAGKVVRVNGVPKRLSDAVGRLTAVLFTAEDLGLIGGSPSLRRRYLDITLAQVEQPYAAARQRFERVLLQRNHLLKRIREGAARPDELSFWDDELCQDGGFILQRRAAAVRELDGLARQVHASLVPGEELALLYRPRLEGDGADLAAASRQAAAEAYAAALKRSLSRDIAAGMTLMGPHRDDLLFTLDGVPAAGYASRAQQRTIALSLRLAEARLLLARRGDSPVLLLDDVLSEMDAARRRSVLASLDDYEHILVTGTDLDRFPPSFLARAALFAVEAGSIRPLVGEAASARTAEG